MKSPVGKRVAIDKAKQVLARSKRRPGAKVDVNGIAEALGVTVLHHDLGDDVSGMLIAKKERAVIVVNSMHHANRQRFSLAHELGHYVLHRQKEPEVFHRDEVSALGTSRLEIEANTFAAELLMPEEDIRDWAESDDLDLLDDQAITEKAGELGVSVQALSIRLDRLGLLRLDYYV
jgi:Zn-dependent peptidase ImmA (M78 family)